jgi:hypothetical protein
MDATADALADPCGLQPEEVTVRLLVDREVRQLVNQAVFFTLAARNLERPDADKYGTHPDGSPRYAPEWYVAQDVSTGIHEGLYGVLCGVLSCEEIDEDGHHCIGSWMHESNHWDGNGHNWSWP